MTQPCDVWQRRQMGILHRAGVSTVGAGRGDGRSIGRKHLSLMMCLTELWVSFGQMFKPSLAALHHGVQHAT